MTRKSPQALARRIETTGATINGLALALDAQQEVFRGMVSRPARYSCGEAGFLRCVSWLYVLYYECGRASLGFLLDRLATYSLDPDELSALHHRRVHSLRTMLQHNLDASAESDIVRKAANESWLFAHCGTANPASEAQWHSCLVGILQESALFFETLENCLHLISVDQFCSQIVADWNFRCSRHHPPHEFDRVIASVAADMGRDHIDPVRIRNGYYEKWSKEFELLRADYDFETEARKRVERVLLEDRLLPITGRDVMQELGVEPGPRVAVILRRAKTLYEAMPCCGDELIKALRQELEAGQL